VAERIQTLREELRQKTREEKGTQENKAKGGSPEE